MLFNPASIRSMELRNRIVISAMGENMADGSGLPTEATEAHYQRLAKGRAGLIIAGFANVSPVGKAFLYQHSAASDEMVPAWQKITSMVHDYGAKIAMQIGHAGRQKDPKLGSAVAPSRVPNFMYYTIPHALTESEIKQTIEDFALAAYRVKSAGFDAVQLHAAHGYLISAFLSPFTNRRRDQWGGSHENRFRFFEETYQAVRSAVGPAFPILCKINVSDFVGVGLTPRDSYQYARRMAELGVGALEISGGIMETILTTCRGDSLAKTCGRNRDFFTRQFLGVYLSLQKKLARFQEAYFLPYAIELRPELTIPLILVGGIRSATAAERILDDHQADFISLGRPVIFEPNLPARWQADRNYTPRCISCNKCLGEVEQGNQLRCYLREGKTPLD